MKAAACTAFGPPAVLHSLVMPDPHPGSGEVRIRVRAAGVQPADVAVRRGWGPPGVRLELPLVVGNEAAGVVDQVGEGVAGIAVGDEVLVFLSIMANKIRAKAANRTQYT